jgi:uncharacterized protein
VSLVDSIDFTKFFWFFKPTEYSITADKVVFSTCPGTDFWQRTYYGFRNDNAHSFVTKVEDTEFTFEVKAHFKLQKLFDQCGIVIYQNSDNWVKASLEYDRENVSKLGSVVTNLGYSDWASTDVDSSITDVYYRLSRRGQDFCIDTSLDGEEYHLMRIFHMHKQLSFVNVGVYACSPNRSSVEAAFTNMSFSKCKWESFVGPDDKG